MSKISRRDFLKVTGVAAAAATLTACGGSSSSTASSAASAASSASDGFSVGQRSVAHKKTMEYGIASSHDDVQGNPLGV